jgi:hypothetical protein
MRDNIISLTASEARSAITDGPLADRARQAFQAAAQGLLAPDAREVLAAGVAALLQTCDDAERAIVMAEVEVLGHLNRFLTAAATGIPLDYDAIPAAPEMPEGAVHIMQLCREAVREHHVRV